MTLPSYATREIVKAAKDSKYTARDDAEVDAALQSASRTIEGALHRVFYPTVSTRYFDWPSEERIGRPWRLWLGPDELISLTSITAGGIVLAPGDIFLEPANQGPPYNRIETNLASTSAFSTATTHQRQVVVAGLWGYQADERPAGALAEDVDGSETQVDVTDSSVVGVGDLIRVGAERMAVTGKAMLDTGQDLVSGWSTNSVADVTATVADGTQLHVGEVVLVDSERVLIVDIAGTTITGKRGWDGTIPATHTTPSIYAARTLTVERGACGTTAATATNGTAVARHAPPPLIRSLCIAEAMTELEQQSSAYALTVGEGDNEREASGKGLAAIRKQARTAHGRKARLGTI